MLVSCWNGKMNVELEIICNPVVNEIVSWMWSVFNSCTTPLRNFSVSTWNVLLLHLVINRWHSFSFMLHSFDQRIHFIYRFCLFICWAHAPKSNCSCIVFGFILYVEAVDRGSSQHGFSITNKGGNQLCRIGELCDNLLFLYSKSGVAHKPNCEVFSSECWNWL
jgi:hypothetical protein